MSITHITALIDEYNLFSVRMGVLHYKLRLFYSHFADPCARNLIKPLSRLICFRFAFFSFHQACLNPKLLPEYLIRFCCHCERHLSRKTFHTRYTYMYTNSQQIREWSILFHTHTPIHMCKKMVCFFSLHACAHIVAVHRTRFL